jgi:hypothetical protein
LEATDATPGFDEPTGVDVDGETIKRIPTDTGTGQIQVRLSIGNGNFRGTGSRVWIRLRYRRSKSFLQVNKSLPAMDLTFE